MMAARRKKMASTGRLAFRVEGEWWNAYWAPELDSMVDAIHLGSIRMSAAIYPSVKESFMETMRCAVTEIIKENFGAEATFGGQQVAPERERAGRA